MKFKGLSTLVRNSTVAASLFAASAVTAGFLAPSASAVSLVPQQEGQVQLTNIACENDPCIDTATLFGYTITSLDYDPNFDQSPLFVDRGATANTYSFGGFNIRFPARDAGTNSEVTEEFWFRPVAIQNGRPVEGGALEIGRFKFDFSNTIDAMTVDLSFFDIEDGFISGILEVNGEAFNGLLPGGPDDAIQTVTLENVSSFVVQLGNPNSPSFPNTGDGVLLQVEKSVPEPGTVLGLGTLAVTAALGSRKRNNKNANSRA